MLSSSYLDERDVNERDPLHDELKGNHRRGELIFLGLWGHDITVDTPLAETIVVC